MAKSLRSKPKLRAKSVKRNGEFAKLNEARNARLAEKLKANLDKQKEDKMEDEDKDKEKVEKKKISTSGPRTRNGRISKKKNKKNTTN
ncbi:CIC11C00000005382 [Sungouiella intermedia]|uniref:CIC11C00000005382 n=1 Tax=Sungouiella intermedia TaxID=45354 RepID=A0A1L0DRZ8_9ASCO|nr:CIC11C00000005382 [[Candida] intermedia]